MKIITHSGMAHADEMCATALLLASFGDEGWNSEDCIERRDPTDAELGDPNVWVIDVGGECSSEKRNFDHHQLSPAEGECAFTLVLKELGLMEDFEEVFSWVKPLAIMDSQGPKALANYVGVDFEVIKTLGASPIQKGLISLFGSQSMFCNIPCAAEFGTGEDPVLAVLKRIGQNWIETVHEYMDRKLYLRKNARQVKSGNLCGMYIPRDEQLSNPVLGTTQLRDAWIEEDSFQAQFSLVQDQRGPGYVLYRYEDDPALDFSQLESDERIRFAHKGGFLASTKEALPIDELLQLVEKGATNDVI